MARTDKDEPEGTVGVSVRVPAEMLREIDRLADQERRTRGNMVRVLLEDALKKRTGAQ